jgi:hypothetical protein
VFQDWEPLLQSEPGAGVASTLFDKGLIFMKDRDILLTGEKWTLTVNIALDDYVNLIYFSASSEKY